MRYAKVISSIMLFLSAVAIMAADATQAVPADDGFDPLLLFIVLLFCAVCLVLVGVGIVVALACSACAALLVALGIFSASALVALFRRRVTSGVRAFHYQVSGAVTAPCGVIVLWAGSALFHIHLRHRYILLLGLLAGAIAGVGLAFVLDRLARFAFRRFIPSTAPLAAHETNA